MERRGAFDYIILETTGLADPGNIAPLFWVDEGLGSTIFLDGVVTMVDAINILRSLDDRSGESREGHAAGEKADSHGGFHATHDHVGGDVGLVVYECRIQARSIGREQTSFLALITTCVPRSKLATAPE